MHIRTSSMAAMLAITKHGVCVYTSALAPYEVRFSEKIKNRTGTKWSYTW